MGGNDGLTAGLVGAEAAAPLLSSFLYGKEAKDLTAEQKSTISSIVGLAATALGATTGDVATTVQSGQVAQNAVEENGLLELMIPTTISNFVKDKNQADALKQQGNLRKITISGAAISTAPYLVAEGAATYQIISPVSQVAVKSGIIGSGMDAANQIWTCPTCSFNYQQNIGIGFSSAVTGLYGAGLASSAGVTQVGFLNLPTNLKNVGGLVIFGNQQILNQAGGKIVKNLTSNENQKQQERK